MKTMNAKIVFEGKEVATITHGPEGLVIKPTEEGKKMCKGTCDCC